MHKPYSESSDQNREPILAVLIRLFAAPGRVLEIGSGTGQHAVYFSSDLPHLIWQPSDVAENLSGIRAWREEEGGENLLEPLELDVRTQPWPVRAAAFDYVYSANTAHIMSWAAVQAFVAGVGRTLVPGGRFALYGPFNYGGRYTSDSNARFDAWLKARDPQSGVRDFEAVQALTSEVGLRLLQDIAMPANNRVLCWERS
ncbi:methylase [Acidihalobacter prosperus]|uniref:Methylase n=2 Tax=Acidihalobacter prosperus TaxID=160660 RepID=A0A1A6C1K7_9GAMM|nr:methylase [Acidihalobacter prosperus]